MPYNQAVCMPACMYIINPCHMNNCFYAPPIAVAYSRHGRRLARIDQTSRIEWEKRAFVDIHVHNGT